MYAVVSTGGKQYRVQEGQTLRVERIPGDIGEPVSFDKVLLFSDGTDVQIGQPHVDGVNVEGRIVEQGKTKKIIVFKYKKRKRYRKKQGHRQEFTAIHIDSIGDGTLKEKSAAAGNQEPVTDETDQLAQKPEAVSVDTDE